MTHPTPHPTPQWNLIQGLITLSASNFLFFTFFKFRIRILHFLYYVVLVNSMRRFAFCTFLSITTRELRLCDPMEKYNALEFALTFHYRSFKIIGRPIFHEYNTDVGKSSTLCLPICILYESSSACLINLVILTWFPISFFIKNNLRGDQEPLR